MAGCFSFVVQAHVRMKASEMKILERRKVIVQTLQEHGEADINDLANRLDVSSMTVRRDLKALEQNGTVSISQGVVILNDGALQEYNMLFKRQINLSEKRRIAEKALEYVNEGESIFLDTGTTVKELASLINRFNSITVMTDSLLVANAVADARGSANLVMCPGTFREMSMAFLGPMTDDFVSNFKIDKFFLSVEGVSLSNGISVIDVLDGHTKRNLVERAGQVICLADSSKFEKSLFYSIAPIDSVDLFITDDGLCDELRESYLQVGAHIERV